MSISRMQKSTLPCEKLYISWLERVSYENQADCCATVNDIVFKVYGIASSARLAHLETHKDGS